MSFSEMITTGRGPGIVGMILALVVLVGFGLLFMFATDERLLGGDQSIESIIAKQDKELESLRGEIARGRKQLAKTLPLEATARQLAGLLRENQSRAERMEQLTEEIAAARTSLASLKKDFASHVAIVRGKAKGRIIPQLKTLKGKVYDNVTIRQVTDARVEIRHDGGTAGILPEELPEALQDEFLFAPQIKARQDARHEADEEAGQTAHDRQLEAQRKKDEEAALAKRIVEVRTKEARIDTLKNEITQLERTLDKEKYKKISKTPQIKAQIDSKRREIERLQKEVSPLRDNL